MRRLKRYQRNIDALNLIESIPKITKKEFKQLIKFSKDRDPVIRCHVAEILMKKRVKNHASKKLLMRMACDRNKQVRTRAYSCLSVYDIFEVELFLKRAIQKEKNTEACYHAIEAWVDVVMSLHDNCEYDIYFVKWLLKQQKIQESEHCLLKCYYALYLFGEENMLPQILRFMESEDSSMCPTVLHILREIEDEDSRQEMIEAIEITLKDAKSWESVRVILPYWKQLIIDHTWATMQVETAGQEDENKGQIRK